MKRLLAVLLLFSSFVFGFEKVGKAGDIDVKMVSEKDILVGENILNIQLKDGDKALIGAKVTFIAFMPEMAGMPYMEEKVEAKELKDGEYQAKFNLSMGGTWQIKIQIEKDDKKYRYKGSFII